MIDKAKMVCGIGGFVVSCCVAGMALNDLNARPAAPPAEIDPARRTFTIKTPAGPPNFFNVENPYFHGNGAVSFKTVLGKEVIIGPAVPWVAVEQ